MPAVGTPCAIWRAGPRDRDRAAARSRWRVPRSPASSSQSPRAAAWRSARATTSAGRAGLDDAIDPVAVALLRAKIELKLPAHHTGEKAAHRMLLPMGRPHDGGDGRSFWSAQHPQHPSLLRARPAVGERVSLGLRLTGAMPLASGLLCREGDLLAGVIASETDRVISPVEARRPSFASGAAIASSVTAMAARPAPVMRRAIAPPLSSRRQTGSEPLALTSSRKPPRSNLSTTFPAALP